MSLKFTYEKGISIGSKLAIVFNRKDYMCTMDTVAVESRVRLQDRRSTDVHKFMTNLLVIPEVRRVYRLEQLRRLTIKESLVNKDEVLENSEFETYWLTHACADSVFEWLKKRKRRDSDRDEIIEKTLIVRNEPLIDLGLALYCKLSGETALNFYRNGDLTIKRALFAGPSVRMNITETFGNFWLDDALAEMLSSFDDNFESLKLLFSNEFIYERTLCDLYERESPFHELTDKQWRHAIACATHNPCMDGLRYEAFDYSRLGLSYDKWESAWQLFASVPVNDYFAYVMATLGETIAPRGVLFIPKASSNLNVRQTIKRWRKADEDDEYGHYRGCRASLGRLLDRDELKDSDDIALRQAYYNGLAWHLRTPDDVKQTFKKDRERFLELTVENDLIYANKEVRRAFSECCSEYFEEGHERDYEGSFSNRYHEYRDYLERKHPEWFAEFGEDPPFDLVSDLHLRTEKRVVFLQNKIKNLENAIIGTESEFGDNEDDDNLDPEDVRQPLRNRIKAEILRSKREVMSHISSELGSLVGWAIVALIVAVVIILIVD